MADHKQATEVTIASTSDESEFTVWVLRWWKLGLGVLLLGGTSLLVAKYLQDSRDAREVNAWLALNEKVPVDNPSAFGTSDPDAIAKFAGGETETGAAPWARYLEASVRVQAGDEDGASSALAQLAGTHPDHLLNSLRVNFPGEPTPLTIVERLSLGIDAQDAWEDAHPLLFDNPSPPDGAPSVRIMTTEGPIVVSLYAAEAPKHVENFLKHCQEGYYNDTKFHRVIPNFMIQGGDPNSKEVDVDLWGQGGPGYKVDREVNDLKHFVGYLAAAKMGGESESSGSQFYFTTGTPHYLDGQHVVFGKVIEGMDTVGIIESAVIVPGSPDRPENPATITSTEVL